MFKNLAARRSQGTQFIRDLRAARPTGFRGRPRLDATPCGDGCTACREVCPTEAITLAPLTLDLGRCTFCAACELACPAEKLHFSNDPRMGAADTQGLLVREGDEPKAIAASLHRLFGRSVRLRQVSAGGCNACELELNATVNVNFDLQRYGIDWVASPRHADGLVVTGPISANMARALQLAWDAMPAPKFVIAVGACAISGGLFREGAETERAFLGTVAPVVYVPGCPVHPLTFAHALLDAMGR